MKFGAGAHQVEVNTPSDAILFRELRTRLTVGRGFTLATLNLDHLTKLPNDSEFASAYRAQDIVVADGRPIVWLSRLARQPVGLMPGSELIAPICTLCAELDVPIALVGTNDSALEGAANALIAQTPGLKVIFTHAPPYGFDPKSTQAEKLLADLAASGAGMCFIALGAPKQEIFAARGRKLAPGIGFASIGAGLDFFAGTQVRAPTFMRSLAMEWFWRACQDPKRMVPRYARCFLILPRQIKEAWRRRQE